jgi:rhodanese-related sulfurtransferase
MMSIAGSIGFIVVVTGILLVASCIRPSDINRDEAHRLVREQGALLLDVRSPEEFAERHPAEAVNVPLPELARRLAELGAHDRPIVVYCHTGLRASIAKKKLREAGFSNVRNLGAIGHWYKERSETPQTFE